MTGDGGEAGADELAARERAERERAERERAARRRAVFGDEATVSADERDAADRARDARDPSGADDRRWYDEQRPPHHDAR